MRPRHVRWLVLLSISLAACSRYTTVTHQSPPPPATPSIPVRPGAAPPSGSSAAAARARGHAVVLAPSQAPAAGATGATPTPTATPTPVETFVPVGAAPKRVAIPRLPSDAAPQILSVAVSETTVHSGDTVSGTVLTTSNVASVEVRIAAFGRGLAKMGVGRFALTYPVGNLPFFVRGTFDMRVIARNTKGDSTETTIPITVR